MNEGSEKTAGTRRLAQKDTYSSSFAKSKQTQSFWYRPTRHLHPSHVLLYLFTA